MNVPDQNERAALLPNKRVVHPAGSWVRVAVAGTLVVAGCAVAAVAFTRADGVHALLANTQSRLGGSSPRPGPHRLSPRARSVRARAASKAKVRAVGGGTASALGEMTDYATDEAEAHADEFAEMSTVKQFAVIGDGGTDGSKFHHLNVFHVYPGVEGCQVTCEGTEVDEATCKSPNYWFCEWDAGRCWSSVGNHGTYFPITTIRRLIAHTRLTLSFLQSGCPANEQQRYDIWDDHYDDYETGMKHNLPAFPDYVYPGTIGCEKTCESHDTPRTTCENMFYCEWDENRCWSKVGPNECPASEHDMHDLWYEYQYKNDVVDGIPATPTPSPMPAHTAVPTPLPVVHNHATPMPTPVVVASTVTAPDGAVTVTEPNGVTKQTAADGTVTEKSPVTGVTKITATDGTVVTTRKDGTTHTSIVPTATPAWTPNFHASEDTTGSSNATPHPTQAMDVSGSDASATSTATAATAHPTMKWDALTAPSVSVPPTQHTGPTPVPLNIVTETNGVHVATNDGMDVDAQSSHDTTVRKSLPAGVQLQNIDLTNHSDTVSDGAAASVPGQTVAGVQNSGSEFTSDQTGHHHLEFPHDYPGGAGCEGTCEGHGFDKTQCESLFFCEWDDGACYSAVGDNPCPNTPVEMAERWLDYDTDVDTSTPSDVTERLEIENEQFFNPTYAHPTIPGAWVGYPGTDGCENVCESVAIDEAVCANMFFCVWDQEKCWSGVGPSNCPDTQHEFDEMMNKR
jgi:hypothetical protein